MIKTVALTKKFGELVAVNTIDLDIEEGEIFGFLGPNGAGKTTTIKLLTGLLKPTSGQAFIGGYDIQLEYKQAKHLIGYLPETPYLYEKLTGFEFLNFVADLYSLDNFTKKRIPQLLETFDLLQNKDHLIEGYSHGMRQKLVLSSLLLHNPKVIIIDEPMSGLDPKSSKIVKNILKELAQEGVTIFISTHILALAQELCHRIGVIDEGRLVALGTIDELKALVERSDSLEEIFLELTR